MIIEECLVHEWHHGCWLGSWMALEILGAVAVACRPGILASFPRGRWKSNKGMPKHNSTQACAYGCAHVTRGCHSLRRVVSWTWSYTCQIAYQRHWLLAAVKCSTCRLIIDLIASPLLLLYRCLEISVICAPETPQVALQLKNSPYCL